MLKGCFKEYNLNNLHRQCVDAPRAPTVLRKASELGRVEEKVCDPVRAAGVAS
jgi:hypothetical protein